MRLLLYRCLRSYKNKFEHDLLDRKVGAVLLNYLSTGAPPLWEPERIEASRDLLFNDLKRQSVEGLTILRREPIEIPGIGTIEAPLLIENTGGLRLIVDVSGPLTPKEPADDVLREILDYSPVAIRPVEELVVRRNLPRATSELLELAGITN
jgi:hypothetical protein